MNELIIEQGRVDREYWKDLWRFRELFYFLAWRDLLVRYKQTVVGVAWGVIRPLVIMSILTVVFVYFAKLPTGGVPGPLLVFCGMLPWQFFSTALSESGNSLVGNSSLISKIYFPRLVIPASSVMTSLVDLFISLVLMALLMVWYRFVPGPRVVFVPFFIFLAFMAALGAGLWVAALMVKYRDFKIVVPFVIQFGLYASPVGYTTSIVPDWLRPIYALNPMVGVIDGFRWAILGGKHALPWHDLALSCSTITLLFGTGIWYFRKTERDFADVI
jgi:lipopolysaccharide transport system permease protein